MVIANEKNPTCVLMLSVNSLSGSLLSKASSCSCKIQWGAGEPLPEVIRVALKCWHEKVFIGKDGKKRLGRTSSLSMRRETIGLYGYTVNGGQPRGSSVNKVIHLLIEMMEQK